MTKTKFNFYKSYWDSYKALQTDKEKVEFINMLGSISFFEEHIDNIKIQSNNVKLLFASIKHSLNASVQGYCDKLEIDYNSMFNTPLATPLLTPLATITTNNIQHTTNNIQQTIEDSLMPIGEVITSPQGNNSKVDVSKPVKKNKTQFIPPSFDEVLVYSKERCREDIAKNFYDYFTAGNWTDGKGNKVLNWKQKFITWETHNQTAQPQMSDKTKEFFDKYKKGEK